MGALLSRTRATWLYALAGVVGLVAAACSSSGSLLQPTAVVESSGLVQQAAARTSDANTARFVMHYTLSGVPELPGGSLSFAADGAFDVEAERVRIAIDLSALVEAAEASGEVPPGAAQQMEMLAGERMESVIDGDVIYQRFPMMAPTGKEWVRIDASAYGVDLQAGGPGEQGTDATAYLSLLEASGEEVTELGREEVRGVPTTRYRATVDLGVHLAEATPEARDDLARVLGPEGLEALAGTAFPLDVWVDDEGLVRRVAATLDLAGAAPPEAADVVPPGAAISFDIEYFDFGADVQVDPPPGDQVIDAGSLGG